MGRSLLLLAGLLAAVVLAEGAVRGLAGAGLLDAGSAVFETVEPSSINRRSENPVLLWELDPAAPYVNSHGFRDREVPLPKPAGVRRIAALGDSVTFGRGVPLDAVWLKVLERRLRERTGCRCEVLNFGVGGYNTVQEAELYRVAARSFEPDLIVVAFVLNDAWPAGEAVRALDALREGWLARSHLLRLVKDRLSADVTDGAAEHAAYIEGLYARKRTWKVVPAGFDALARYAREDGVPVVVAILPMLEEFRAYPFTQLHRKVGNAARARELRVVDLLPVFRSRSPAPLRLLPGDRVHPNAEGHALIAESVADFIVAQRLAAGW